MKSADVKLTIAIPTWRRPEAVAQRVAEISEQLFPGVEVIIFENGESLETADAVAPYLGSQIHYKSSQVNRGFTLNVLRCFEESHSNWVWILGDDDRVLPGSVAKVMAWLESCSEDVFVTSRPLSTWEYAKVSVSSLSELFAQTSFSEALFISSTIWKRSEVVLRLDVFCDGGFSMGPQMAVMLNLMESGKHAATVYFDTLVEPKSDHHRWSRLRYIKRILSLFDLMETAAGKKSLADALLPAWNWAAVDALKEVEGWTECKEWGKAVLRGRTVIRPHVGEFRFSFGLFDYYWKSVLKHKLKGLLRMSHVK